jgi:hypothetical protein
VWAGTGRLAKNASLTGDVLLNGRRKANLSYGTAVSFIHHPQLPITSYLSTHVLHLNMHTYRVLITRADCRYTLVSFKCEGTFFEAHVIMYWHEELLKESMISPAKITIDRSIMLSFDVGTSLDSGKIFKS